MPKCADTSHYETQFSLFDNFATLIHLGCRSPNQGLLQTGFEKLLLWIRAMSKVFMNLLDLTLTAARARMTPRSFPPKCFKNQETHPNITLKGK